MLGMARTGGNSSNGSGDFVIAFSTNESVRRIAGRRDTSTTAVRKELTNDEMSPLFEGVIEATEEAIYNSLFMATSVRGVNRTVEAIPLDRVREILAKYNVSKR